MSSAADPDRRPAGLAKKLVFILPAALFVALVIAFASGLTRDPRLLPSALIGRPAPDFALPGLFDKAQGLSRADLAGHVSLINFFASWCVPCRQEQPVLMALSRRPGVVIDGIAYKDKPEDARRLIVQSGNPYRRIGVDSSGRTAIDFGVYGVPETYLVDPSGEIRYRQVGPLSEADVEAKILPLIRRFAAASERGRPAQGLGSRSSLDTAARKPGRSGQP